MPVEAVAKDLSALTLWSGHRFLAGPEYPFEVTKIGGDLTDTGPVFDVEVTIWFTLLERMHE